MNSAMISGAILATLAMAVPAFAQEAAEVVQTAVEVNNAANQAGAMMGGATERRGERFEGEKSRRYSGPLPYDHAGYKGSFDGEVTYDGRWTGTWTGNYNGGPETVYKGSFDGDYKGTVPPLPPGAHAGYGRGYAWVPPYTVTTTYHPTKTTTTVTEEYVDEPVRASSTPRRVYKPRTKTLRR